MELTVNGVGLRCRCPSLHLVREFNEGACSPGGDSLYGKKRDRVAKSKDTLEVSGGGKNHGNRKGRVVLERVQSRSPLWKGGGQTFAAVPKRLLSESEQEMYRAANTGDFV